MDTRGSEHPEEPDVLRPNPDLAGTPVEDVQGQPTGEVYGVLSDAASGLIRYLDVEVEDTGRHVLVPLGHTRLERERGRPRVQLRAAHREQLAQIPPYEPEETDLDDPYQRMLLEAHGRAFQGELYYAHPAFDHSGLYAGEHPIVRAPALPPPEEPLQLLSRLEDFQVAEGEPDIRGWPVRDSRGERVATVDDLVIDPGAGKVRYAVLALEDGGKKVLLPVGYLKIREGAREVRTPALDADDLQALPAFAEEAPITREDEERIRAVLEERLDGERRFQRPDFAGEAP